MKATPEPGSPPLPCLHVVIPCFNEAETLERCLDRVLAATLPAGWERRVVVVDDHSGRDTAELVESLAAREPKVDALRHVANRGKGAAVRTGIAHVLEAAPDEDVLVIQDADLEYHPDDFAAMLGTLAQEGTDVVYGDRFDRGRRRSPLGSLHTRVNRFLTRLSNLATGLDVNDMECCYKLIPIPLMREVLPELTEDRFGFEPQVTAALARRGVRIANHPVTYEARGFGAGKKIGASDGVRAVLVILRERLKGAGR